MHTYREIEFKSTPSTSKLNADKVLPEEVISKPVLPLLSAAALARMAWRGLPLRAAAVR